MDGNFRIDGAFNITDEWGNFVGKLTPAGNNLGPVFLFIALIFAALVFAVYGLIKVTILGLVALASGDFKSAFRYFLVYIVPLALFALLNLTHHIQYEWNQPVEILLPPGGRALLVKFPGETVLWDGNTYWQYGIAFEGNWQYPYPNYQLPNSEECIHDPALNDDIAFYCQRRPADFSGNTCVTIGYAEPWSFEGVRSVCIDYTTGRFR